MRGNRRGRACRLYPTVRGVLRQSQYPRAIDEERGAPRAEVETPLIQLRQRSDQSRCDGALVRGECFDLGDEPVIGKAHNRIEVVRHDPCIASSFLPFDDGSRRTIEARRPSRRGAADDVRLRAVWRVLKVVPGRMPERNQTAREKLSSIF